jgi:heme A synthase
MYTTVQFIHSYWAYLVLIVLLIASFNAIIGFASNKEYSATNFRIALFTLIVSHIQLLIGIVLYLTPGNLARFDGGMGEVMSNDSLRLYLVEHPLMMIIALALITIGYSKHKKKLTSRPKFKVLAIFYTLGLLVILTRIPWDAWF